MASYLIRTQAVHGLLALVSELGGNADELCREAGIEPAELSDPNRYISHPAFVDMLERAATELNCPTFGLRLLDRQDFSVTGPIALATQHANDLREALDCASRYIHVQGNAWHLSVLPHFDPRRVVVTLDLRFGAPVAARQQTELAVGILLKALQMLTGDECAPLHILMPHERIVPMSHYESRFPCPVLFGQPLAGIVIPRKDMRLPVRPDHKNLAAAALAYLESQYGPGEVSLRDRVRSMLRPLLATGRCTNQQVAYRLAMHSRTLHRRLAREGASFEALKDEARRELATVLLAQSALSLTQVATALGYAEQSSFSRSCVRWFGASPRNVRQQLGKAV